MDWCIYKCAYFSQYVQYMDTQDMVRSIVGSVYAWFQLIYILRGPRNQNFDHNHIFFADSRALLSVYKFYLWNCRLFHLPSHSCIFHASRWRNVCNLCSYLQYRWRLIFEMSVTGGLINYWNIIFSFLFRTTADSTGGFVGRFSQTSGMLSLVVICIRFVK